LPLDPDEIKCFDDFHKKFGKYIAAATEKRWSLAKTNWQDLRVLL
jgi:hypothetical protein